MIRSRRWFLGVSTFLSTLAVQTGQLWAQLPGDEEVKEAWVISYALVILCIGLGLYLVCRPARRNKTVKAAK